MLLYDTVISKDFKMHRAVQKEESVLLLLEVASFLTDHSYKQYSNLGVCL